MFNRTRCFLLKRHFSTGESCTCSYMHIFASVSVKVYMVVLRLYSCLPASLPLNVLDC